VIGHAPLPYVTNGGNEYEKIYHGGYYPVFWVMCILVGLYVPMIISKIAERTNNSLIKKILGL